MRPGFVIGDRRTGAGAGVPGTRAPLGRATDDRTPVAGVPGSVTRDVRTRDAFGSGAGGGGGGGAPWGQLIKDMSQWSHHASELTVPTLERPSGHVPSRRSRDACHRDSSAVMVAP
ncbi:hypothetical protein GCM10027215_13490 [Nocardioides zeae]